MADVSFTSRIRPVSCKDFNNIVSVIPRNKFVSHPWLIEDSKMGQNVFTTNICDCTSCLISNGQEALLMHLSPMQESNHFFNNVLIYLRNHLDLKDENLQAILVGSKNTKKSLKTIENDTERDHYLDAEEALEYGLIDKIIKKKN